MNHSELRLLRKHFAKGVCQVTTKESDPSEEYFIIGIKVKEEEGEQVVDCAKELKGLITEYEDLFQPLKGVPPEGRVQHEIVLISEAKPVMKRPYRLAESPSKGGGETNRKGIG